MRSFPTCLTGTIGWLTVPDQHADAVPHTTRRQLIASASVAALAGCIADTDLENRVEPGEAPGERGVYVPFVTWLGKTGNNCKQGLKARIENRNDVAVRANLSITPTREGVQLATFGVDTGFVSANDHTTIYYSQAGTHRQKPVRCYETAAVDGYDVAVASLQRGKANG